MGHLIPCDVRPAPHGRARYARYWGTEFWERVNSELASCEAILDLGGGRRPTILPEERPSHIHYVGLDPAPSELAIAPPGSYDEAFAAGAEEFVPELVDRFDMIVSWQVLEHVPDLPRAAAHLHAYLRGGGSLVSQLSGRNAAYAIVNRLLPTGLGRRFVAGIRGRELGTVFAAHYDHCDERGLHAAFSAWAEVEVIPLWRGADYFERIPGLLTAYLSYEDLAIARGWTRMATNYVLAARKADPDIANAAGRKS